MSMAGGYTPNSGAGFVSYSLAGADTKYFTINKETGVLSFVSAVDAENGHGQLYSITIWANENKQTLGTPWISKNFVLTIGDVDESPITWQNSNSHPLGGSVAESYNNPKHLNPGDIYPIDLVIPVSPFAIGSIWAGADWGHIVYRNMPMVTVLHCHSIWLFRVITRRGEFKAILVKK